MNSKNVPHVIHQFWMSNIYPYYYLNSVELEVMKRWLPFRTVLVFNPYLIFKMQFKSYLSRKTNSIEPLLSLYMQIDARCNNKQTSCVATIEGKATKRVENVSRTGLIDS
jgi:hypothetical protein